MIIVDVRRSHDLKIESFAMSGHAESGPYGQDLVCAGASAVSIGTLNAIAILCEVELDVESKEDGGFLRCCVPSDVDEATFEKIQLLLEGMLVSLQSIAEEYHAFIKINDNLGR
ncbi:ribosomal-processing cysteine protease Prp [Halalkalibacter hemicellulosilyticus]|uniref:Ribosomal processing cysteine protease Prp n=1 Tax=Halalkalibacter hemicellulosilyticusJCM 9152 TaxID=1236971 RepID=W4QHM4_9BACI|nr:ribosomal-processing cysteine protease Prp [Halalkalibacter hemicellulosilyticus]GAE31158.1 ribosomal protein [Halalkalibacter hemicellulosilyticusJCM 9152]